MSKYFYYHNPRCSKSRAGLDILEKSQQDFCVVEYLKETPAVDTLISIFDFYSGEKKDLIRIKEEQFKSSGIDIHNFDSKKWANAVYKSPKLLERPILVKDKEVVIGRPPENLHKLLKYAKT